MAYAWTYAHGSEVRNCNISNLYAGIAVGTSSGNNLSSNNASGNGYGIELWSSNDNILSGNTANLNVYAGIDIDGTNNTLVSLGFSLDDGSVFYAANFTSPAIFSQRSLKV
jgi:parallel beta-helix repeat protein